MTAYVKFSDPEIKSVKLKLKRRHDQNVLIRTFQVLFDILHVQYATLRCCVEFKYVTLCTGDRSRV